MQTSLANLPKQLLRGLNSLYVLHGDETLLVEEAADAVRAAARAAGFAERSVFVAAGARFDWSAVLAAGNSLSLFAERQIVEIRVPSGKPGKEGSAALQQIATACRTSDGVLTLVLLPRLDKATRSSAWFEALISAGVNVPIDSIERPALPQWIAQRLAAQKQRVAQGDEGLRTLQFFADRVEGNLLAAHQEIQKLALLYPEGELMREQVESAVLHVARYDVFKLSDAVLGGQVHRVLRMLEGLQAEGEAAVLVHWALADDIRAMKRVTDSLAAGKPMPAALRENRIWGSKERHFERITPQMNTAKVAQLLDAAHTVDGIVKGLPMPEWPTDPWQALQQLAVRMALACRG